VPDNPVNPLAKELLEVQRTLGWMDLVIGNISDAVYVTDSKSQLIFVNQHFADILSVPRVFLYGQMLRDVFDIKIDKKATDEYGSAPKSEYTTTGIYTWKKHATTSVFKISSRVLPNTNQTVYLAQDISHDKELSDMKSAFINLASHQLRTPMTSIMLQSHMLEDAAHFKKGSQEAVLLSNIIRASERMINLITDILNITKIQSSTGEYTKRDIVQITDIVTPLKQELEPAAHAKRLSLTFSHPTDNLEFVSNKAALNEILSSLLINAIQYTPENGSVQLAATVHDSDIVFTVTDTGIGIPKHMLPHIFDQFTRADNAFSVYNEGTGLGLYLVKILALKLGAQIQCESEVNKGTTFTVRVPISR
jgi:signal transduction histidine kinase